MPKVSHPAFTLIEALVVIAIIAITSVFYIVNLRPNTLELMRMDTTRLAADIRYIRSMATSRVAHNGSFPSQGYGIAFHNGNGTNISSYYQLYAGDTSSANILKTVTLSNVAFRLVDPNNTGGIDAGINDRSIKIIAFKAENSIADSGFDVSADGDYQIQIYYYPAVFYYKNTITIGRKTTDNFLWSNLAITYDTNRPVCGNGIVETGEICERTDGLGSTNVIDSECFPASAGAALGCKRNYCGDGIIFGAENCEGGTCLYPDPNGSCKGILICPQAPTCYGCKVMANSCSIISGGVIQGGQSCCSQTPHGPLSCVNCQLQAFDCGTQCQGYVEP